MARAAAERTRFFDGRAGVATAGALASTTAAAEAGVAFPRRRRAGAGVSALSADAASTDRCSKTAAAAGSGRSACAETWRACLPAADACGHLHALAIGAAVTGTVGASSFAADVGDTTTNRGALVSRAGCASPGAAGWSVVATVSGCVAVTPAAALRRRRGDTTGAVAASGSMTGVGGTAGCFA